MSFLSLTLRAFPLARHCIGSFPSPTATKRLFSSERKFVPKKEYLKNKVQDILLQSSFVGLVAHKGLNAAETNDLRFELREKHGLKVTMLPNKVVKRHLEEKGIDGLGDKFEHHVAIIYSKEGYQFKEFHNLKDHPKLDLLGAYVDHTVLEKGKLKQYANLPSIDELRSQVVMLLQTPQMQLTQTLSSNQSRLAYVLGQIGAGTNENA
eukprot:m.239428 g.239428  ORF g.239428 m.239428 type:complete len:208 (+) comp13937_c0_seq12:5666-6289(+)